jgi:hypothetical protein
MDNGKAKLFAKGTGLRALLERNGFEFFDRDEAIDMRGFEGMSTGQIYKKLTQEKKED